MSVAEQFAGLNMKNLIGGPLTAAADASIMLARSTAEFINDVGFDADGKIRTAAFGYERRSTNDDGTSNLEEMKVAVPMLAIVPIPNLQIDEVNVLFDMEVKQSERSEKATDLGASLSGSAKFGPIKVNITGSVSSHSSNTRSSDNSAKYHVDVRATNHGTPEGLSRVLDMMAACISPVLVGSELKDGNGQNLTDKARMKAEDMKRLRSEIMALETQVDAAKNGLESNIQRMKSTAECQQNNYQAMLTKLISNLTDSQEDKDKADTYSDVMEEIIQSWTTFRSRAADLIKLVSDSGETKDGVSELFGLKAFDSKNEAIISYAKGQAQYDTLAVLQKNAVESQKVYDNAEASLLAKRVEYNNAVSGTASVERENRGNKTKTPAAADASGSANGTGGNAGNKK